MYWVFDGDGVCIAKVYADHDGQMENALLMAGAVHDRRSSQRGDPDPFSYTTPPMPTPMPVYHRAPVETVEALAHDFHDQADICCRCSASHTEWVNGEADSCISPAASRHPGNHVWGESLRCEVCGVQQSLAMATLARCWTPARRAEERTRQHGESVRAGLQDYTMAWSQAMEQQDRRDIEDMVYDAGPGPQVGERTRRRIDLED